MKINLFGVAILVMVLLMGAVPMAQGAGAACDAELYAAIAQVAQLDSVPEGSSPRYWAYSDAPYLVEHWGNYPSPDQHIVKVTRNKTLLALGYHGAWIWCDKSAGWKQYILRKANEALSQDYSRVEATHAVGYQQARNSSLQACLPANYAEGKLAFTYFWESSLDAKGLADLPAGQVAWLGYGPGQELGKVRGFEGINIYQVIPIRDVLFPQTWQLDNKTLDRLNIAYYLPTGQVILSVFTQGGYHIPASPTGGICMWWVEYQDWEALWHG